MQGGTGMEARMLLSLFSDRRKEARQMGQQRDKREWKAWRIEGEEERTDGGDGHDKRTTKGTKTGTEEGWDQLLQMAAGAVKYLKAWNASHMSEKRNPRAPKGDPGKTNKGTLSSGRKISFFFHHVISSRLTRVKARITICESREQQQENNKTKSWHGEIQQSTGGECTVVSRILTACWGNVKDFIGV